MIDSSEAVAGWVKNYLDENPAVAGSLEASEGENGGHRFFVSDLTPNSEQIARDFLGRRITLELPPKNY